MVLAPAVGALLGCLAALLVVVVGPVLSPLVTAVLAVFALAGLTRAVHLDGLADSADGLGSGRERTAALQIMRSGDTGPFGVVAIVLVLMIDVAALTAAIGLGHGPSTLVLACMVGRLSLPLSCRRGIAAARDDGLGATVAGTVPPAGAGLALVCSAVGALALGFVVETAGWRAVSVAFIVSLLAGELVLRLAVRRLGGVTGDVLGAVTEVTTAVALVCLVAG
jgi:adenosylcobinamide-GDP ribazoletransferase